MTLKQFKNIFLKSLSNIYPQTEIESFFLLIEEKLGLQRIDTVLQPDFDILVKDLSFLESAIKRLQNEEPIQYILAKTEFYGLPFLVNQNTLIPRPETEELVEWVLREVEERQLKEKKENLSTSLTLLDIGTGTGCIAISLAKKIPKAKVFAIDISEKALAIAKKNAKLNKVSVNFFQADILDIKMLEEISSIKKPIKFDIIISNPPYIRELEKRELSRNVLENEPHIALFVKNDKPLIFYTKIAELAKKSLKKNGNLYFEINEYLGKEMVEMLQKKEFKNTQLKKDISGKDRFIKVKQND